MEKPLRYTLTYNNESTILEHAPRGWESSNMETERSSTFYGISRSYTFPLEFVKEGAVILRNALYTDGIEALVLVKVEKYDYVACTYVIEFEGEINYAVWTDNLVTVKTNAIEGSKHRLLKANENTKYEIVLPDILAMEQILSDKFYFAFSGIYQSGRYTIGEYYFAWFPVKLTKSSEVINIGGLLTPKNSTNTTLLLTAPVDYPFDDTNTIIDVEEDCTITYDISVAVEFSEYKQAYDGTMDIIRAYFDNILFKYDSETAEWVELSRVRYSPSVRNSATLLLEATQYPFVHQNTVNLKAGDKLAMVNRIQQFAAYLTGQTAPFPELSAHYIDNFTQINTKVDIFTGFKTGNINVIHINDLLKSLSLNIFNDENIIESTLLSDKNIVFASGNSLRGIANSKIKISLNDLFKFTNSCYNSGIGIISDKLKIEEKAFFFSDTLLETFENVNNFEIESADDQLYNVVKIGCNAPAIEAKFGNQDYNSTLEFQQPLTKIAKVFDLTSPIRFDSLGIDALRAEQNYENTNEKDNANDNEMFAIVCKEKPSEFEFSELVYETDDIPPEYFLISSIYIIATSFVSTDIKVTFQNGDIIYPLTGFTATGELQQFSMSNDNYTAQIMQDVLVEWNSNILVKKITTYHQGEIYTDKFEPLLDDYSITSGVETTIKDLMFNKSLTPKRSLLRHGNWLRGMLYGQPLTNEIKFLTAQKNSEMISSGLTEKANVKISDLDGSLFDPFYFNFTAASKVDTWQKLLSYPERYVEAIVNGKSYKGWIMKATLLEAKRDEIKFKLLGKTPIEIQPEDYRFFSHNRTAGSLSISFYLDTKGDLGAANIILDFGDGTISPYEIKTQAAGGTTITHTYESAGDYTVKFKSNITENAKLYTINLNSNRVTWFYSNKKFVNLYDLYLSNNLLTSLITYPEWSNFDYLEINNNLLITLELHSTYTKLRGLQAHTNLLTTLTGLEYCVEMQYLLLYSNKFVNFNFPRSLTKITNFYIYSCLIENFKFTGTDTLYTLWRDFYVSGNKINQTDIDNIFIEANTYSTKGDGRIIANSGTNAAPSSASLAARTALLGRSPAWTITTN